MSPLRATDDDDDDFDVEHYDDDDDDEELLQRALEDQAKRDLPYTRRSNHPPPLISPAAAGPPSRQPPPAPPPRRPPPPRPSQPQPSHLSQSRPDEEDESEVELLSLSSEDEAEDDQRARRRSNQAAMEEDLDWNDDDEPDCWRRVEEEELARKVKEMREAKLTIPQIRKVITFKRRVSNTADGFSQGDNLIDPLRPGELIDAVVVKDHTLREKLIYDSEKFDAKLCLSHVHQNTSYAQLDAGRKSLKLDLQNREEQLKQLVKENFDCFVSCKSTIDDIHAKLQKIEADIEGAGTVHLSNSMHEVVKVANRAFGPLFERQVQAERIKSVQGMLQRFRTLFNLPSTIRTCISKGEYDQAVREYKKAKSLVLPTHVSVLKRVLEDIDKVIFEFKEKLLKSMENPNLEFTQLESNIQLLLELEPGSDPIWHYLTIQSSHIQGLLEGCYLEHTERMDELKKKFLVKSETNARWKELQKTYDVDSALFFDEDNEESFDEAAKNIATEQSDMLLGHLINRLTMVLVQYLPSFWQLATTLLSGKFGKVSHGSLVNGLGGQSKSSATDAILNGHSSNEVIAMIVDIVTLYQNKVLNAFQAFCESNALSHHMLKAVDEISRAYLVLQSQDTTLDDAVQILSALKVEVTQNFISRLSTFTQNATLQLQNKEDWVAVSTIERGGTSFAISGLPLNFQAMLVTTMDQISEILEMFASGISEVQQLNAETHALEDSVKTIFYNCFFTVHDILNKMAINLSDQCQILESETLKNSYAMTENHFSGLQAGVEVVNPHQRLLMILSNVGYCKASLLPGLLQKYQHIWSSSGEAEVSENGSSLLSKIRDAFCELEDDILVKYTKTKAIVIGTAAGAYFLEDGIQWGAAPDVKGIRDAVVELLHPIIVVHAELYAGARPYLEKALPILIEGLMDALLNVFEQNKLKQLRVVDLNGFTLLALELNYLETVIEAHLTASARGNLSRLREQLKVKVIETMREIQAFGNKRSTNRGTFDDGSLDEKMHSPVSSEELNALERQVCEELLQIELKRTKLNIICFSSGPESNQSYHAPDANNQTYVAKSSGANQLSSATGSRHRRRMSGSSWSDSDSGKPSGGYPPQSPLSYTSSDIGSETGINDSRYQNPNNDRYTARRSQRRPVLPLGEESSR